MKKIFFILILLIFLKSPHLKGQEKWTLDKCIRYAISNNLELKGNSLQNEIYKENLNQSKRNLLPYVSMGIGGNNSFGKSLDYDTYEYINTSQFYSDFDFYGGIDIFKGFSKQNTISFRKMTYLAGLEDEKLLKYNIAFSVMEAYYNTVYYKGLAEIADEQKNLSELNLAQTKKQVKLGLKAKSDLLEMESRLAKEELNLIQAQNYYKTAVLDLKQAMNITGEENFSIDFSTPAAIIGGTGKVTASEIYSAAETFYPTIKAEEMRKDAASKSLSAARGGLWPSLTMSGGYSSYYSKTKDNDNADALKEQFKNNASQYVGLSLSIPVFSRLSLRSNVKLAKLNYLQAETKLKKTSQELYNEISQNYQSLESYSAEYKQLEKQVDYAQVAYGAAEKKHAQGLISIIELYDSKNILAQAKSDLLRTKLQYIIKEKTIEVYQGKTVFGFSPKE